MNAVARARVRHLHQVPVGGPVHPRLRYVRGEVYENRPLKAGRPFASVVLELPFVPEGRVREELSPEGSEWIWSQEFAQPLKLEADRTTRVVIPARLLSAGQYRLVVREIAAGEEAASSISYVFRVSLK